MCSIFLVDLLVFTCASNISSHLFPTAATAQRSSAARLKDSAPPLLVRDSAATTMEDFTCKDQTVCSYQQISCLDSVIRYGFVCMGVFINNYV